MPTAVTANLNTILLTVSIGLLGWMAYSTHETGVRVSALTVEVSQLTRLSPDNVQRREFDSRVAAIESKLAEHAVRIREIDLQIIRLQKEHGLKP